METNHRQSTVMDRSGARADIDAGLRSYMLKVYNYMALGIAFTGLLVLFLSSNQELMNSVRSMGIVFFIGILAMGWFSPKIITMRSAVASQAYFWVYAAMWGFGIAPMVHAYLQVEPMLVARAFLIAAGMFAGMSLFGYTTKKDLSGWGRFLMMASIGLLIAIVVNGFFLQDIGFSLLISCGVVLLIAAATAYETQMIRDMYYMAGSDQTVGRYAIFGALLLYGSFITLFIHLLNILGIMSGDD